MSLHWDAFSAVIGTPDHICLYQGRQIANVIPRRAFATPDAATTFLEAAREWHAAAMTHPNASAGTCR